MANGKPNTWPDGSPRSAAPLGGPSSGSTKNGVAIRRADGWQNQDVPAFGGLPAAAQKSDARGGPCVPFGPNSGSWSKSGRATTKPKG
jgi:hypothetical protein